MIITIFYDIYTLTANMKKVKHLLELPKAQTHLTLWKADLAEEGSFDDAIKGCTGVFHVATPMDFESKDPEVFVFIFIYIYMVHLRLCVCIYIYIFYEYYIESDNVWGTN